MIIKSEQEMLEYGRSFAREIDAPAILELVGDVGTGKTTFVRGLAEGLDIEEPVTSPSFTISKVYALKNGGNLIHYDFYRLNDPGLMVNDLLEKLSNDKNIVVIEWADSVKELLPSKHLTISFAYDEAGGRMVDVI